MKNETQQKQEQDEGSAVMSAAFVVLAGFALAHLLNWLFVR